MESSACDSSRLIDYFFVCGLTDADETLKSFKVFNDKEGTVSVGVLSLQ